MTLEMEISSTKFPRVEIAYCTQCKWLLRAAWLAQELLSTFSTSLGEVALQPSTGGTFIINLYNTSSATAQDGAVTIEQHLLWDRKAEGGFPEAKELKRRVRDIIEPSRDLGHVDGKKKATPSEPVRPPQHRSVAQYLSGPPIPKAINRLQASSETSAAGERKFTPMDVDETSRPTSRGIGSGSAGTGEVLNARGKIQIGGEGGGFCQPGQEDCEDCG